MIDELKILMLGRNDTLFFLSMLKTQRLDISGLIKSLKFESQVLTFVKLVLRITSEADKSEFVFQIAMSSVICVAGYLDFSTNVFMDCINAEEKQ